VDELRKITSVGLVEHDWLLLKEMTSRSGWKRGKIISLALRYLYKEQFEGKNVNAEELSHIWEA